MNNCVSMLIQTGNRPGSPNTFELLVLFLTPSICLQSERWNFSILLKLFWYLGSPQLSQAWSSTGLMVVSITFKYVSTVFPSDLYKNRWSINHDFFALFIKFSILWYFFPRWYQCKLRPYFHFLSLKVKFKFSLSCSLFVKNHYFCFA